MSEKLNEQMNDLSVKDSENSNITNTTATTTTSTTDTTTEESTNNTDSDNNENVSSSEDCSLYVGDLPAGVTEAHLFELFSEFGGIKSILVAKDNILKRSLGYAFVNYNTPEEAQKALNDEQPKVLNNCTLRVMEFQRDPAKRTTNSSGNLFIKNLDPSIDSTALSETFSSFGKVVSCKIAYDENGNPRGFGYVLFENPQHAEDAIAKMNGVLMNDRPVTVSHHVSRRERMSRMEHMKQNYTNLYVKNIAPEVEEEEFKQMFEKYGQVVSMSLPLDNENKSRGFGFVNFATHEQAVEAVENLNGLQFHEKRLYVSRAQKKYERMEELRQQQEIQRIERMNKQQFQGTNLYIKYLDSTIDDEELKEIFSPFGEITSAKIMTDDNGQSRGFGFVCYSTVEEAHYAIQEMHQTELKGRTIYVNLAQRKDRINNNNNHNNFMYKVMSPQHHHHHHPQQQQHLHSIPQHPQHSQQMFMFNKFGPFPGAAGAPTAAPAPPPAVTTNPAAAGGGFMLNYYPTMSFVPHQQQQQQLPNQHRIQNNIGNNRKKMQSNQQRHPNNQKPNGKSNQQAPFGSSLSAAVASASSPEAEKQVIGEALYPKVIIHPVIQDNQELAGKVTGMLLDQNTDALLQWFDDDNALDASIQQAYEAYMEYLKN